MNRMASYLLLLLAIIAAGSSTTIGCDKTTKPVSQPQVSPQDVFIAALNAANTGNYSEAERYLSSTATAFDSMTPFPRGRSDAWDKTTRKRTIKGIGVINERDYCESIANWQDLPSGSTLTVMVSIYYQNSNCDPTAMTEMVKENGTWQIKNWNSQPSGGFLSYPCPRDCGEDQETYISFER